MNKHFTIEDMHVAHKYIKDAEYHMPLENYKLKWDITIHLLEWPKFKAFTAPKVYKDVKQQKLSFIAGGNAKC